MLRRYAILATVLSLAGCAGPTNTASLATSIAPGQTKAEVTRLLGPPMSFISQSNDVECLIYRDREGSFGAYPMTAQTGRDRVIALRGGQVISSTLVDTTVAPNLSAAAIPGAATPASVCAQIAANYGGGAAAKQ